MRRLLRGTFSLAVSTGSLALSIGACSSSSSPTPPAPDPCVRTDLDTPVASPPKTPRWAFEPWISKDISTRADTYDFVDGFRTRGIPIGAVVLDSPWETNYNTFVPNPSRYGDLPGLVTDMHSRNVKVVVWITSLVNNISYDFEPGGDTYPTASPNLQAGLDCNYFIDSGQFYQWWKGEGAGLDFFNPSARAWWHRQMDGVLATGIDGFKTDFGESYLGGLNDTFQTADGPKARQEYSEHYYADFLDYSRSVRGADFVTLVRAWDESYGFAGRFYAKKEDAPVAWMGDNRRDYVGLADALNESFISAQAGYVVVGSDIGGYLDHDDKDLLGPAIPFDTTVFARWTAMSALSPFMQLHGRANITPWTVPDHVDETVALYKYWATLHHALAPFFYSLAEEAYAGRAAPIVRPVGDASTWPNDFRYLLGDAFLVAPILDGTGKRDVVLPAGTWFDFFTLAPLAGGTTVTRDYSADTAKIPLFVKEGAIVPLLIDSDVLGLGTAADASATTVLVWPSARTTTTFALHEDDDSITTLTATTEGRTITLSASAAPKPLVFRVRAETAPSGVLLASTKVPAATTLAALEASATGFFYDGTTKSLVIKVPAAASVEIAITLGFSAPSL